MTKTHFILGVTVLSALFFTPDGYAQNAIPAPKQKTPIALVGGTIYTVSGDVIESGTVVFQDGKILDVGVSVDVPAGAERYDVSGKHVYPGLVDAYNTVGLIEIGGGAAGTIDRSETGQVNPSVHAEVAFHPESQHIPVARSGGVTVVAVSPGGGLISGFSAAMMLEGWTWEEMTLQSDLGLIVNWPQMQYLPRPSSRQTKEEWKKQRDKNLMMIRNAFDNARAYMKAKGAEAQKRTPFHESNASLEAMIPVLNRDVPIVVNAYSISQIQAAVRFSEEQNVRLILAGAYDAWRIAPLLKEKGIPIIIKNIQSARRRWEPYDAVLTLPKKFMDAGLTYCITGYGRMPYANARNLSHHAANATAFGLPRDEALRAITLFPAQILGIDDRVGSLESGKDATLFVADGDMLEISTTVEQVYIQGRKVDMKDKHVRLYEKYKEKYKQLKQVGQ